MTHPTEGVEDRLAAALRAEAAGVESGDGSLDAIRRRARAAYRRRRAMVTGAAAMVVVAVAVAVPAVDRSSDDVRTGPDRPSPTTTTDAPATTTVPDGPESNLDQALWPDPAGERFTDPVAAARSFVEVVIGVDDPSLSAFQAVKPGAGEVSVARLGAGGQPAERTGIASVVTLRRLDGEHWFVTSAAQPHYMQIDFPEPLATVSSPVTLAGQRNGPDGAVVAELRLRSATADLLDREEQRAEGPSAGSFSIDLSFEAPASSIGVLVATEAPDGDFGVPSFAAIPVRLGAGRSPAPVDAAGSPTYDFGYQPLWPFRTQAEADAWHTGAADEGHSPWLAEAEATALFFTSGYLGFSEIDEVTSRDVRADEAWIGVGYQTEGGGLATAAVIHLRRFGPSPEAPWEVVGTRDTTLTLDTPRYGSAVSSPLTVRGTVTGVDESLRVQVRQPSTGMLGERCCLPAGGEATPWETSVSFSGATDAALTVVVSTGGHVREVERFAITGVTP